MVVAERAMTEAWEAGGVKGWELELGEEEERIREEGIRVVAGKAFFFN